MNNQLKTTDATKIDFRKKFDLTDKVVVISGACGLIGRAFCEAAAQFGAHVVCAWVWIAESFYVVRARYDARFFRLFANHLADTLAQI